MLGKSDDKKLRKSDTELAKSNNTKSRKNKNIWLANVII